MNRSKNSSSCSIYCFKVFSICIFSATLNSCAHNPYAHPAHHGPVPFDQIQIGDLINFNFESKSEGTKTNDTVRLEAEVHIPFVALTAAAEEELQKRRISEDRLSKKVEKISFYGIGRKAGGIPPKDWNLVCRVDTNFVGQSIYFAFHPEIQDTHTLLLNDFDVWSIVPATVMKVLGGPNRKRLRSWIGGLIQDAVNQCIIGALPNINQGATVKKVVMRDWVLSVTIAYESLPAGQRSRLGRPVIIIKPLED